MSLGTVLYVVTHLRTVLEERDGGKVERTASRVERLVDCSR